MRNYTQEQKLQLQTLISQEAMLPAKLFKYLRSEEHLPSLLALVDVPGFSEPLMCSVPANQVDRLNKPVSIRDLQPGFRVVLGGLEEDGSLTASRRRAQELIYDRLFLHPDRRQVYQGRVMGISSGSFTAPQRGRRSPWATCSLSVSPTPLPISGSGSAPLRMRTTSTIPSWRSWSPA